MVLKINQKYFKNCLFLWKPKTYLKGTVAGDFLPPIFFLINQPDSTAKNMPQIAEMKLPRCGVEVVGIKNCDSGATFL
jgi:hypothetical protein